MVEPTYCWMHDCWTCACVAQANSSFPFIGHLPNPNYVPSDPVFPPRGHCDFCPWDGVLVVDPARFGDNMHHCPQCGGLSITEVVNRVILFNDTCTKDELDKFIDDRFRRMLGRLRVPSTYFGLSYNDRN